ncbi:hypothetical protein D3C78_382670 [compost metagenome]
MAGGAWRKAWVRNRCAVIPQVPSATAINPWIRLGVCQNIGTMALITSVLSTPVKKLLVVGLSIPLSLRVSNW